MARFRLTRSPQVHRRYGYRAPMMCLMIPVLLAATGCQKEAALPPVREPTSIHAQPVLIESSRRTLTLPGLVEARARVELPFRVDGTVSAIYFDEGDHVQANQILAELDTSDLERAVRAASAALESAQARADQAGQNYRRQQKLLEANSTSREQHEDAESSHRVAKADLRLAQVALEDRRGDLGKAILRAPFAGYVESRLVEPHEWARAQSPALVLLALETVSVRAAVPDRDAPEVILGTEVTVRSAIWPDRVFTGRVKRIAMAADPGSRMMPFEVEIYNPDAALRPELVVDIALPLGPTRDQLLVPLPAILRDADTRPFAFLVEQNERGAHVRRQSIELGAIDGDRVSVRNGLSEGEMLVVRGQHFLRDGDRVRIMSD